MQVSGPRQIVALGGVLAALLLAGCGPVAPKGSSSGPVTLQAAFKAGQTLRYKFHARLAVSVPDFLGSNAAQSGPSRTAEDVSGTITLKVLSVDPAGTATVRGSIQNLKETENGRALSPDSAQMRNAGKPATFQITKDGRVTAQSTAGDKALAGVFSQFPINTSGLGSSSFDPQLPAGSVKPGDSWSRQTEIPFAKPGSTVNGITGGIKLIQKSTFARYETVNGSQDAVIRTTGSMPVEGSIDLSTLFSGLLTQKPGQPSAPRQDQQPSVIIRFSGNGSGTSTTWFNPASRQFDRVSGGGSEKIGISFSGLPSNQAGPSNEDLTVKLQYDFQRL